MRVLVDMNLTPDWVGFLAAHAVESVHWSAIGDPRASDTTVMDWARRNAHVVSTHDLDFGALLALAGLSGPSVVQVRTEDVLPSAIGSRVINVLREHSRELELGALITVDEANQRVRVLPIRSRS